MRREEFKAGFADRLRRARIAAGYKTWGLCEQTGVVRTTLWAWEHEAVDNLPNAYNLAKLCEALHVDADWLLFGKDKRV